MFTAFQSLAIAAASDSYPGISALFVSFELQNSDLLLS
jgi:hypothetical protein